MPYNKVEIIGPPGSRVLVPVGKGGVRPQTKDPGFWILEDGRPVLQDETRDAGGGIKIV